MPTVTASGDGDGNAVLPVLPEVAGPGPATLTTLSPEMQQQIMLQQQAFAAALAGGAGGMAGLQIALPPGVTLEQASMMGLPIMALPVQLPSSSGATPSATASATLPLASAVLPRVGGGPGILPAAGLPPAMPRPVTSAGCDKLSDGDEFTVTGRRKRKDTGGTVLPCWLRCPACLLCTRTCCYGPRRCRQAAAAVPQLDG